MSLESKHTPAAVGDRRGTTGGLRVGAGGSPRATGGRRGPPRANGGHRVPRANTGGSGMAQAPPCPGVEGDAGGLDGGEQAGQGE